MSNFCPSCGKGGRPGAKFCAFCGETVATEMQEPDRGVCGECNGTGVIQQKVWVAE